MSDDAPPETEPCPAYATLEDWIGDEAVPFSLESPESLNAAVDAVIARSGGTLALLGFGEALHGGEELLLLRNRLFQRLVETHGFSAIAIESSLPRSRLVEAYVAGTGSSYDAVREDGFSHGFGWLEANRELVAWMREYNADPARRVRLRFYGFDSPTEMTHTDSPREVLHLVLDYLDTVDPAGGGEWRGRIDALLGPDADWENPAAMMDPAQSVGRSPAATALRAETEDLAAELRIRRPELVAESGADRYAEALHYATVARQLLTYHAGLARKAPPADRLARGLGMRDAMMAENLAYVVARERRRGRVLAFAHNSHLQRGPAEWLLGPHALRWWTAGAQLASVLGPGYAVIGSAVGVSDANGIGRPEAGTLEARLGAMPGPAILIPTCRDRGLPDDEVRALPTRSRSARNSSYFPLAPRSLADFDWLAVLDATAYARGGPPLPGRETAPDQ